MTLYRTPRDQVLGPERWPVVNAAMHAELDGQPERARQMGVKPLLSNAFYLLWSDYSAGRDLDEIRDEFASLIGEWSTDISVGDTTALSVAVGVWIRAFGLDEHLETWLAAHQAEPHPGLRFDEWVLGNEKALDDPELDDGFKQDQKNTAMAREIEADPENGADLLAGWVRTRWYRDNANAPWWNSHNDETVDTRGAYRGYWCWPAAAISMITGVDDSQLKGAKYYPYDLVHYLDS